MKGRENMHLDEMLVFSALLYSNVYSAASSVSFDR